MTFIPTLPAGCKCNPDDYFKQPLPICDKFENTYGGGNCSVCEHEMACHVEVKTLTSFDEWWLEMKPAECDEYKVYFLECWERSREVEMKRCAQIARETVCDTHLPTGVKIYGTRVAKAILGVIQSN